MDYFEVFGLPRRLAIDESALRRRFYELSRRHHPDFHQGAPPTEQLRALERSALVNAAYRALRDPLRRIEYLLRLEEGGQDHDGGPRKRTASPGLLAEMFEVQEALEEAKTSGLDETGRRTLRAERARLEARLREEEARLRGPLSADWDAAGPSERPAVRAAFRESLATRAYLRTVIDDLAQVLGEGPEAHVTHHRH